MKVRMVIVGVVTALFLLIGGVVLGVAHERTQSWSRLGAIAELQNGIREAQDAVRQAQVTVRQAEEALRQAQEWVKANCRIRGKTVALTE